MECTCSCFVWAIVLLLALGLLLANPVAFFVLVAIMFVIKMFER